MMSGKLSISFGSLKMSFSGVPIMIKLCGFFSDIEAIGASSEGSLPLTKPISFCLFGSTRVMSESFCFTCRIVSFSPTSNSYLLPCQLALSSTFAYCSCSIFQDDLKG
eukprot:Lithocolla_globosa_v1_NODE_7630_length_922_cov_1.665513.p2 type:complete len:108 gc:universal NODE_7630_length_922_cov_1.665513:362-39(-)